MSDVDFGGKPFEELNDEELAALEAHDWTSEQIVKAIHLGLQERDMPAVVSLMHRLAVKDPRKAAAILAVIEASA